MPLSHRHKAASLHWTQGGRFTFAMVAGRKTPARLFSRSALGEATYFTRAYRIACVQVVWAAMS